MRYARLLWVPLLLLLLGVYGKSHAATRIGLHTTQEEIWCWRQRAGIDANGTHGLNCRPSGSGRYKTAGDVSTNSPGDWDRIVANRNAFAASPSSGRWSAPPIPASCVDPGPDTGEANWPEITSDTNAWSIRLRDAAFYGLVTGSTTDRAAIQTELLWLVGQTWMNFGASTPWCYGLSEKDMAYWTAAVLTRVLYAYDYVGRLGWGAGQLDTMDRFFFDAADYWRHDMDEGLNSVWVDRWNNNYTATSSCSGATLPFVGGTNVQNYAEFYNNRRGSMLRFSTLAALYLTQAGRSYTDGRYETLARALQSGKKYVEEYLRYSVFPQGFVGEFARRTTGLKDLGYGYAGIAIGEILTLADTFARTGDTSLYTLSTSAGICGTAGTINDGGSRVGQNKDLLFLMQSYAKYPTDVYARYWPDTSTADNRIDGRDPRNGTAWQGMHDTNAAIANLYFQDSFVQQAYTRTHTNSVAYPSGPAGGTVAYMGEYYTKPGNLFMFGQMEGVVNPYSLTSSATPTLAITAPTSLPAYGTGTTPITVGGVASDDVGVTGVTWTCPTCSTTSGTATCTPTCGASATSVTWSIGTLGFPSAGTYTLTVTATDGSQTATDTLTIVYSATPPDVTTALELWYGFEEASGNALDSSGHGHTGTLTGGATRTTGKVDASALSLNGTTAYVSTAGLLTTPAAITVAAWVKLSAIPTGWVDVVSLGDTIVLRAAPGEMRGVYSAGSSTWHNTVGAVAWDTTTWRHMAFVAEAGAQAVYLDGVPLAQTSTPAAIVYSGLGANTVLGTHGNPAGTTNFVAGAVDDVRVYTRFLAPRDIVALAAQEAPPDITSAKVLHLTFDDGANPTDDSGSGNQDATLSAGTTFVTGKIGALAARFSDNSGHLVTVPGSIAYATTGAPFTVALWTNLSSFPLALDYPMPLQLRSNGSLTFEIDYSNDVANSCLGVSFGNTGGGFTPLRYVVAAAADLLGWHHLAIVYNGTGATTAANYTLYWDGVAQTITTALCPAGKTQATTLGGYSGATQNGDWQGDLDDVYVYARALTQAEVAALMALPGPSAPVAGSAFRLLR